MQFMRSPIRVNSAFTTDLLAFGQRVFMCAMVIALAIGTVTWQPSSAQATTWTTADNVNLRAAPDATADSLLQR